MLVIALFTGLVGGLLSTLLAGLYVQVWLHGGLLSGTEWLALTVFLIGCTITSLICEATRQSRAAERRTGTRLKRVVADLEQAADALQQSEKKFRSIFEQAAVGVARLKTDGTWLEVNEKLCRIVGYSRQELLQKSFQDITYPVDLQADLDYVDQLLRGDIATYSMEKRYFRKDGDVVWINLTVSLARDDKGDPDYFISVIEDITERKQANLALRNSEERFRALFEQSGGYCMILDPNTPDGIPVIVDANTLACTMHGYDRDEFIGRPVSDIDDESGKRLVKARTTEIMTGKPFHVETTHVRKDGTTFSVSVNAKRIDIGGEPPLIFSTEYDVTEREELHQRIEKIATHVPGMIYQYQQWPGGRTAFPYASEGMKDIYGVEPAAVSTDAAAVFETLHPEDRSRVKAKIAESMHRLITWHDAYRVRSPDGRLIWVEGEASPEPQPDGSVLWHGFIRDVSERKRDEEQRQHLQGMLSRTERLAQIGSWEWEFETDRVTWSDELFRIFQLDPAEGAPPFSEHHKLFGPDDLSCLNAAAGVAISEGTPYALELRARRRDGTTRSCLARGQPETGPNHAVTYLYGTFQDITERKQAENELRLAASVFAHSLEAIVITDAENRIVDANPAFSAITGYQREAVLGKDPKLLSSGRHGDGFYREMWEAITQKGSWKGEIWNRRKDGEVYAELLSISAVSAPGGRIQNYIAVFSDISEFKAHEAELDRIANYDHLTGVPNRRLLGDRLEQAIAAARRSGGLLAVCYLDLDDFKPINDRYGHDVGDQLLIGVTTRLRKVLRAQDTLARLGGDEFVLLFNDLRRLEDSYVLLERVLAAASLPILVNGITHGVSASIGVTLSPPDVDSADGLLRHADQAMYRAKEAGRNRYHFYDQEQDRLLRRRRLRLQRIKAALDGGEFKVYFQPEVDMVSREVISAEALIRWRHPQDGLLLPGAFLPEIEGSDIEIAIGEWVIETALTQVATWKRLGLHLPVSVNISARHLLQPNFAERLQQLLAEQPECDPGCLQLEILETTALSDIERAAQTLAACHALGVRFALDDFGTGYSSLAYFRRLPIDVLKIDQSFVRDMLDDPNDMEIVESVVKLARAFNRSVIAEGVETPEHGALLTLLGCRLGQGFGIARPMPADEVPRWVSTWPKAGERMDIDEGVSRDDIPLMMAMQNHRHWVDEFADALKDSDLTRMVAIAESPCRFERWYQGSGSGRYGKTPAFESVGKSHVEVHELASTLMALAERGEGNAARARLPELLAACDALIGQLKQLIGSLTAVSQ